MTERLDYVVLELDEYNKLNSVAKTKLKYYLSTNELLFLSALCKELNAQAINLIGTTVEIISDVNYNKFDIKLCRKYYNKVSRFISEVL